MVKNQSRNQDIITLCLSHPINLLLRFRLVQDVIIQVSLPHNSNEQEDPPLLF